MLDSPWCWEKRFVEHFPEFSQLFSHWKVPDLFVFTPSQPSSQTDRNLSQLYESTFATFAQRINQPLFFFWRNIKSFTREILDISFALPTLLVYKVLICGLSNSQLGFWVLTFENILSSKFQLLETDVSFSKTPPNLLGWALLVGR